MNIWKIMIFSQILVCSQHGTMSSKSLMNNLKALLLSVPRIWPHFERKYSLFLSNSAHCFVLFCFTLHPIGGKKNPSIHNLCQLWYCIWEFGKSSICTPLRIRVRITITVRIRVRVRIRARIRIRVRLRVGVTYRTLSENFPPHLTPSGFPT